MSNCINFLLFHEKNLLLNVKVCALLLITFGGFSVSCFFLVYFLPGRLLLICIDRILCRHACLLLDPILVK